MKTPCLPLFLGLLLAPALFGDSVRFTETLTDRLVTTVEPGVGSSSEVVTTIGGTISVSINLPGLAAALLPDDTVLSVSLGGFAFSDTIANADIAVGNSATYFQYVENLATGLPRRVGQITFSRSGNTLIITGASSDLSGPGSIEAENQAGESGPLSGQVTLEVAVGGLTATRPVYFKGTGTATRKVVGPVDLPEEFFLNAVTLTGEADFAKPVLSIQRPVNLQRWSNEVFTVQGKCTDNVGVGSVLVRLNGVDLSTVAPVAGQWSQVITLVPGTNVIQAVAVDADGNQSLPVTVRVIYVLTFPVDLVIDAGGSVIGVSNGQILEIGRSYTATARGSNGFLFSGWSGDLPGTNPVLKFAMVSNLTLHAGFIPNPFIPVRGLYAGLFHPGSGGVGSLIDAAPTNSGYFSFTLTDSGVVSGKILLGGATLPFSNLRFRLDGSADLVLPRPGPDLSIHLQLNFVESAVTGTVGDGSFAAGLLGHLAIGQGLFAGRYTLMMPGGAAGDPLVPAGDGVGAVSVDVRGLSTVVATLGDGTAFSQGTAVSRTGDWPVFASLQAGRGVVFGWASFTTNPNPYNVTATGLTWIKAPALTVAEKLYRAGFRRDQSLIGARYLPPAIGLNAVGWSNGVVTIDGGNLRTSISNLMTVANNRMTILANSNRISLTVSAPTGLVTGNFKNPAAVALPALKGVVIQLPPSFGGSIVGGWFSGTNQTGYLDLRSP